MKDYDFSGWVTKNDIQCSDGVIIRHNAFADCDNKKVPLVWNHNHNDPGNVLGHVILHSRDQGVYGYGYFNNTSVARDAKELVKHGDIASMSIAANKIRKQNGRDVVHGNIYEVSLVMAGANPGALIDRIKHSDIGSGDYEYEDGEGVFCCQHIIHSATYKDDLEHAEDDGQEQNPEELANSIAESLSDEELESVYDFVRELVGDDVPDEELMDSLTEEQSKKVAEYIMQLLEDGEEVEHSDEDPDEMVEEIQNNFSDEQLEEIYDFVRELVGDDVPDEELMDSLTEEQAEQIGEFIEEMMNEEDDEEEDEMKHNVFESQINEDDVIQHSQLCSDILADAQRLGSLRESMIQHGVSATIDDLLQGVENYDGDIMHSISTIDDLLTVETFDGAPQIYRPEDTSIVDGILNEVRTTPKHTVRKRFADLTTEEARAKGYIKGNQKLEEVFGTFDRVTYPQTIYKKQSLDNDDIIDIDWDIISFIRAEMKEMWRYELARAIIQGDGRLTGAADKIKETNIRPIMSDDVFYTTKVYSVTADNFVEKVITAMATSYKGTGTPTLYIDKVMLAQIRLKKDDNGRYLWGDKPIAKKDLADLLGVAKIVEPDFMASSGNALIVNLTDYEVAAPNKGKSNTYEDFDIDYNKHKYLLEGRCAGALVQPKAAVVLTSGSAPTVDED